MHEAHHRQIKIPWEAGSSATLASAHIKARHYDSFSANRRRRLSPVGCVEQDVLRDLPLPAVAVREQAFLVVVFFWQKTRSVPIWIAMDVNLPSLDQFRNNAAACIRLAEAARTSEHKSFFIEMAERSLTLAEHADKTQAR
jgi:hypothetical protein